MENSSITAKPGSEDGFKVSISNSEPLEAISVLLDIVDGTLLGLGIGGMYQGIEICHPIYALLFTNLLFPFMLTVVDFSLYFLAPFEIWYRQTLFLNSLCALFHTTSWSIISVLRYIHIEHQQWLLKHWPSLNNLTPFALISQFLSYFALLAILIGSFFIFAGPYGWPQKSFLLFVPNDVQSYLSFFTVAIYLLPMLVSGIFFILLVRSKRQIEPISSQKLNGLAADTENAMTFSEPVRIDMPRNSSEAFDYNKILRDVGLPYDNADKYNYTYKESTELADPFPILGSIGGSQIDLGYYNKCEGTQMNKGSTTIESERESEDLPTSVPGVTSRVSAERAAALRSLKTNLSMTIIFCFSNLFLLIPSNTLKMYFCVIATSVVRALLPISTTIANFGTIRSLALKFLELLVYNLLG